VTFDLPAGVARARAVYERNFAGVRALTALGAGAVVVLGAEWARGSPSAASGKWFSLEAAVMGVALLLAWLWQGELRSVQVLVGAVAFALALVLVRHHVGSHGDIDVNGVYREQGQALLDGRYPRSEYPPGAVVLFALDVLLGGGHTRTSNALIMVAFQAAIVASLLALRSQLGVWPAAIVAFWPANTYFWEYRYDLAPTAFVAVGLLLAYRRRFGLAGLALGVGAAVKWTPALACLTLLIWLVSTRMVRAAISHAAGFAVAFAVLNVPFLVWRPGAVLHAYSAQGLRSVTAESFIYPPLRLLGLAHVNRQSGYVWDSAEAPHWANGVALGIQLTLLALLLALVATLRGRLRPAIALAALTPSVFLLSNRIFSPQFAVGILVCTLIAAVLLVRNRRQQLAIGCAVMFATAANALVYPARINHWIYASAAFFAVAFAVSAYLCYLAVAPPTHASAVDRAPGVD
jgi:hypothetical protein